MSNTLEYIKRVIRIAEIANQTEVTLDELHGMDRELGISLFDSATMARFEETNIAEIALNKFLESLPLEDLRRIHALMYSGRDGDPAPELKAYFVKQGDTQEDIVRTIGEKCLNLPAYLERGLRRARTDGVDVNAF